MATDGTEPRPGATGEGQMTDAEALARARAELKGTTGAESTQASEPKSGFKTFQEQQGQPLAADFLKGAEINPEAISEEALQTSAEKVARYLRERFTGMDGQPLPDTAADLSLEAVKAENEARINRVLAGLATGQPVDDPLFTEAYMLKVVFDADEAYRASLEKARRYMPGARETGFDAFTKIMSEPLDLKAMIKPETLTQRFKAGLAKFARYATRSSEAKPVGENPEPKPPAPTTPPQGPTQG